MTTTASITANQVLTRVGVEVGLDAVADPFGSPTQHYTQLRYLLQTACEELCLAFPWEFLVSNLEITTVAGQSTYALPDAFQSMIDQTGWDQTNELPIIGPLSAQEWEALIARDFESVVNYGFRIQGGELNIYPAPPVGLTFNFQYQSRNFAESQTETPAEISTIVSGSDVLLFDRTLITRYLKVMWLEAKGFDTTAAQNTFNQTFNFLIGKDKGGAILNAGRVRGGRRLLDYRNIPDSGYGLP
jgi:hypothetical protein